LLGIGFSARSRLLLKAGGSIAGSSTSSASKPGVSISTSSVGSTAGVFVPGTSSSFSSSGSTSSGAVSTSSSSANGSVSPFPAVKVSEKKLLPPSSSS